jgi:hypothetical protein
MAKSADSNGIRLVLMALALIVLALGLLFGVWGVWLLATPDYDGGRRPVGAVFTAFAAVMVALGSVGAWVSLPRRGPSTR